MQACFEHSSSLLWIHDVLGCAATMRRLTKYSSAAQRAMQQFPETRVVTIAGRPSPWALFGLAWTLFVDTRHSYILAADLPSRVT